jgi:bifunctional non-homologous end joining protein LigD
VSGSASSTSSTTGGRPLRCTPTVACSSTLRSKDWLKFAHRRRESYVVGGWRLETDSQDRLGAVLVGQPTDDGLLYRGRVGSGIAGRKAAVLREVLSGLTRTTTPFADEVPKIDALGTTWVEPVLVVDIESLGPSAQGRIRQPSYVGTRADLTPEDLR